MGLVGRYGEPIRSAYALAREEQIPAIAAGLYARVSQSVHLYGVAGGVLLRLT